MSQGHSKSLQGEPMHHIQSDNFRELMITQRSTNKGVAGLLAERNMQISQAYNPSALLLHSRHHRLRVRL
jgi:hypothetical protein